MKLALVFLAILGVTLASPRTSSFRVPPHGVKADDLSVPLGRLLENIDTVELDRVIREIFETDQGGLLLLYLRGAGFGRILDFVGAEVEVQNILDYATENGLPEIRDAIAKLWADLGITRPDPRSISPQASFEELLEQLAATIDQNGLVETVLDVINNDLPTINFLYYLSREEVAATWQRIKAQPDVDSLLALLRSAGLPVDQILTLIESLLGWGRRF